MVDSPMHPMDYRKYLFYYNLQVKSKLGRFCRENNIEVITEFDLFGEQKGLTTRKEDMVFVAREELERIYRDMGFKINLIHQDVPSGSVKNRQIYFKLVDNGMNDSTLMSAYDLSDLGSRGFELINDLAEAELASIQLKVDEYMGKKSCEFSAYEWDRFRYISIHGNRHAGDSLLELINYFQNNHPLLSVLIYGDRIRYVRNQMQETLTLGDGSL